MCLHDVRGYNVLTILQLFDVRNTGCNGHGKIVAIQKFLQLFVCMSQPNLRVPKILYRVVRRQNFVSSFFPVFQNTVKKNINVLKPINWPEDVFVTSATSTA